MKKLAIYLTVAAGLFLSACSKNDEPIDPPVENNEIMYISKREIGAKSDVFINILVVKKQAK
ncbi:MAG: hypothetical protein EOO43_17865, partial [Flavobacterium sp.]